LTDDTFHPLAWLVWLTAAALPALSTRNPLYLSLVLLAVIITYWALGRRNTLSQRWGAFVRFGALLWLLTIPFTALTSHAGEIVLFRLPRTWPLVGGPITLEGLLYGLTGGLALVTLLLIFATFNVAVDQARLLRLTPAFMYQAGVVTGIAVAFVPQMVASWQSIREAQQVRGHRVRGIRDMLPLILPLLTTSLERAMQLAESMEARGFGGQVIVASARRQTMHQLAILIGLGAVAGGLAVAGFWAQEALFAGLLIASGIVAAVWSFWDTGRRAKRTRYRRWSWRRGDRLLFVTGLIGTIGWALVWLVSADALLYYPFPPLSPWPQFSPLLGSLILLLVMPAVLLPPVVEGRDATFHD
jgi:energy-coupling factor transport system permease protein